MILETLRLNNFKQHEDFVVRFAPIGITLIQGSNGSGKSSLMEGLSFAVTGVLNDDKASTLRWGSSEGSVTLTFTKAVSGQPRRFQVTRSLESSSAQLLEQIENKWVLKGKNATEVNAFISAMLGSDIKNIDRLCFAKQGELDATLRMRDSERTKLLHRYFQTDKYEKTYAALGQASTQLLSVPKPFGDEAELQAALQSTRAEINEAERALRDNEWYLTFNAAEIDEKLSAHALAERASKQLLGLEAGMSTTGLELELAKVKFEALRGQHSAKLVSHNQITNDHYKFQKEAEAYNRIVQHRAALTQKREDQSVLLAGLRLDLKTLPEVDPLQHQELIEAFDLLKGYISTLQSSIHKNSNDLAKMGTSGASCPTCGTQQIMKDGSSVSFEDCRKKLEQVITADRVLLSKYQEISTRTREQIDALVGQTKQIEKLQMSIEIEEHKLATLTKAIADAEPVPTVPTGPTMRDVLESDSELNTLHKMLQGADMALSSLRRTYSDAENAFNVAKQQSAKLLDLNRLNDLQIAKTLWSRSQSAYLENKGKLDSLRGSEKMQAATLAAFLNAQVAYTNAQSRHRVLACTRDVFHRDALPSALAKKQIDAMNSTWNSVLTDLDVPFSVELTPALDVSLIFDGRAVKIGSASGGQVTCASLAFAIAAHRCFCSQTGFIVLDEPTYGLDAEHLDRVVEVLHKINALSAKNGIQVLIVTHEEAIASNFDSTIRL